MSAEEACHAEVYAEEVKILPALWFAISWSFSLLGLPVYPTASPHVVFSLAAVAVATFAALKRWRA